MFSRLFGRKTPEAPPTTQGRLAYAVGDIHGRLDAFDALLHVIAQDVLVSQPSQQPMLILLGDYVDRGPASAQVIDAILRLQTEPAFEVRALKGNHEEALLQFRDEPGFGQTWVEHGGSATLASYGVQPPATRTDPEAWETARRAFREALPEAHKAFFEDLEIMITLGDYAFVHAGVRPGVPLERQVERDLLWIRAEFLQSTAKFEKIIVHGHTPMEEPQIIPGRRIGVDTGAYATGLLTAVRLDDSGARILQARAVRSAA
ncbi:metallophosphoesterase family protein [Phenylobacterium sp.]|uniref:metallophosphoesterase family protein n=1 Tax=Phenylobacterium sp. TaxID=1871053 RepID=UPI002724D0E5|nr:metallophosphoesterase family protein [Phenylobacterium sp.]MDO8800180.1 metallophosphoesterase family protein [Phenylobacterium sp.]